VPADGALPAKRTFSVPLLYPLDAKAVLASLFVVEASYETYKCRPQLLLPLQYTIIESLAATVKEKTALG
jgi:hypothetical protein